MRSGLVRALEEALHDESVEAIVLTGKGRMFCAGADIREFGKEAPQGTPALPSVIDAFEQSRKPVVVALHGVAAGGGLELALGCHARIAARGTRLGLPEVTLGIIPGAGGTQRLPRLIGVRAALEHIVAGKLVPAARAAELGIIDEQTDESELLERAVGRASELVQSHEPLRRASELTDAIEDAKLDRSLFKEFEKGIQKKARGFEAPYAAIEAVRAVVETTPEEGFRKEREIFLKLVDSDQARAQRHIFFAEREVWKIPEIPKDTREYPIERVGVIGFGTMGSGIAMCFANAGLPVTVVESDQKALDRGFDKVRGSYASSVSKGRFSQEEMDACLSRIHGVLDYSPLADADLVVEAVFENLEVKQEVFRRLDEACRPDTILATNTSTLDVDAIASVTSRSENVMGTHFFSPAHVMKLMENVRGAKTSKETIATVMSLSKRLGKVGVLVGVCDGFVGNRMLYAYRRQADFLLEEGALPHEVDRALYDFGLPMGPFAMADMAGLDIGWAVRKSQAATRPNHLRYSPIADRICERGRFGQKTGAGWYRYEEGSRVPIPDPEIESLIESVSRELGIERRAISSEEIVERCVCALINEGAKILEEGIALRSSDVDIVWIYGYGFPRYRGGPMFYADTVGVKNVYEAVSRFYAEQGEWMTPAPLLKRLANEKKRFADLG
jgi:3-hydroxyacyl-CoA dehydrogenase